MNRDEKKGGKKERYEHKKKKKKRLNLKLKTQIFYRHIDTYIIKLMFK